MLGLILTIVVLLLILVAAAFIYMTAISRELYRRTFWAAMR